MTHNIVFNTDCFASLFRETQLNTTQHKLSLGCWYLIAFILFSFLSPFRSYSQQLPFICDNGGFENGYTYYTGWISNYKKGSNQCNPKDINLNPVVFSQVGTLPEPNRIQIVQAGNDPYTNYATALFESQALRLNSWVPPIINSGYCIFQSGVDRVTKSFLVTDQNRFFTVWFSAVLLFNPDHIESTDNQPFFSMKCNLAPNSDACYNGFTIPYDIIASTGDCVDEGDYVKATNWVCHRFFIDRQYIGQTATLEITAADCGESSHFGYAYIDGICEPCNGNSSYGSGEISPGSPNINVSCNGDSITINGSYTTPTISGGYTIFHDFNVPGFNIYNKTVNTTNKTFSFKIVKSDFQSPNPSCRDLIVYLQFKNSAGNFIPDIPTNALDICLSLFTIPDLNLTVGSCNRNHPTNNVYSDDYYYVDIEITNATNTPWVLMRQLDDPLPDESGLYTIRNGTGNGNYHLGPFLIQDGGWDLILFYNNCSKIFHITPPDYCSGCAEFSKVKIFNIQCDPTNGWSYDIMVPNQNPQAGSCWRFNGSNISRQFNQVYNIPVGPVGQLCINRTIKYFLDCTLGSVCEANFDICPPKPCNNNNYEDCSLEVYFNKLNCINNGGGNYSYTIDLLVSGAGFPCFKALAPNNTIIDQGSFNNPLGPYSTDVTIIIYSCGGVMNFSCECPNTGCYKVFKIRKPEDCTTRESFGGTSSRTKINISNEVEIQPNPVLSDEFIVKSILPLTEYEIYNSSGVLLSSNVFKGLEHRFNLKLPSGIYLLRYKNLEGEFNVLKFVKL
ncbi:MAG: T9SS type A sorting domain-containing protein [Saprospiraceae bacterium]|uniref:T9SS type A sorting domain-containing protein n=1 Tax=Candidatus Defluviibacterium haderslevense TaxID=2981993 RepID=A0A9D7S842_9BACT|nr:T9SS type A sorting domain-containing protein [Candidatus Defluviibacterium haderslevense]